MKSGEKITLNLLYYVKIPNNKFTNYGFEIGGGYSLKNWLLTPARIENNTFVTYSNLNLDDIANAPFDIKISIKMSKFLKLSSDLNVGIPEIDLSNQTYFLDYIKNNDFEEEELAGLKLFLQNLRRLILKNFRQKDG